MQISRAGARQIDCPRAALRSYRVWRKSPALVRKLHFGMPAGRRGQKGLTLSLGSNDAVVIHAEGNQLLDPRTYNRRRVTVRTYQHRERRIIGQLREVSHHISVIVDPVKEPWKARTPPERYRLFRPVRKPHLAGERSTGEDRRSRIVNGAGGNLRNRLKTGVVIKWYKT